MALIKYGGGIVQMSGSIAGNTHARNRFGNYIRPRTKPVNPRSSRQMAARIAVMYLAEQWGESPMTDAKRLAWETYAAAIGWLNALGETIHLTGFQHFLRSNAALSAVGAALVDDGPTTLVLPPGDPAFAVTASVAATVLSCVFDTGFDWVGEDDAYCEFFMGQPQNHTRNFFNGPYRMSGFAAGDSITPPTSPIEISPDYTLVEGQKVWCQARIIRADGRCSKKFSAAPFIVAA